jgi:ATP-dependent protease ClpP protease subunit
MSFKKTLLWAGVLTFIVLLCTAGTHIKVVTENPSVVSFDLKGEMNEELYSNFSDAVYEAGDGGTIQVNIDSPGGYVVIGNAMISLAKAHHIRTECTVGSSKYAMSMAVIFLLSCDTMKVHDNALLLFHQPYYTVESTSPTGEVIRSKVRDTIESVRALRYGMGVKILHAIGQAKFDIYMIGGDVFISGSEFNANIGR